MLVGFESHILFFTFVLSAVRRRTQVRRRCSFSRRGGRVLGRRCGGFCKALLGWDLLGVILFGIFVNDEVRAGASQSMVVFWSMVGGELSELPGTQSDRGVPWSRFRLFGWREFAPDFFVGDAFTTGQ